MSCRFQQIGFIAIVLTLHAVSNAFTWLDAPSNTTAVLGGVARINCSFDSESVLATWTDPSAVPLFINNQSFGSSDQFSIEGRFDLKIRNVQKSNRGYYTCSVSTSNNAINKGKGYLDVLIPPYNSTVSTNNTKTEVTENEVVSLTCSSVGNPAPTIQWYRGDTLLVNGENIQIGPTHVDSVSGGTESLSSSQLVITSQSTDHNQDFICQASNSVNLNNPVEIPYRLRVQFAPRVALDPSPYNIILGTSGSITCNVKANPPANSVQWYKESNLVQSGSVTLPFTNAQKSQSGNYSCQASNIINGQALTRQASAMVSVIYEPVISVPSTYTVNATSTLRLPCQVDANPRPISIKWKKTDGSSESSSDVLEILGVDKSFMGNYSCIVRYRLEPTGQANIQDEIEAYTFIYVQYHPGQAVMTAVANPITIGQSLTLKCTLQDPGYPSATFEWRNLDSNDVFSETSDTLVIPRSTLQNNGNYSCRPRNIMGYGEAGMLLVDVHETPSFFETPPPSQTILSNTTSFLIMCKVKGRPAPQVVWYKNNEPIRSGDMYTIQTLTTTVERFSFLVSSTLVFQGNGRQNGLEFSDIANYTCREVTTGVQHVLELFVLFKPTTQNHEKVAATANLSTTLSCTSQGYPIPQFTWYRQSSVVGNSSKYGIRETHVTGVTRATSSMVIRDIEGSDFGNYSCVMVNSQGTATKVITLTVKNKPESPANLQMMSYTWESVVLSWQPGFNGGEVQIFRVFYVNQLDPSNSNDVEVVPHSALQYNVTGLFPGTSYKFEVYGTNKLGAGNRSSPLIVQTKDLTFPLIKSTPEFVVADGVLTIPFTLNMSYCVRVKYSRDRGATWSSVLYENTECFVAKSVIPMSQTGIDQINVSVCLVIRQEVCARPISAAIRSQDTKDLTETEVIIIGIVCLVILAVLIGVLVYIVCRRRKNAKEYENRITQQSRQGVPTAQVNGNGVAPPKPKRGYENQGMDYQEEFQMHGRSVVGSHGDVVRCRGDTYSHSFNVDGPPPSYNGLVSNGQITLDTSYDSQLEKYENDMNMRNIHNLRNDPYFEQQNDMSPGTPRKDPTQFVDLSGGDRKDIGLKSGQESGYSTPETQGQKPKKVIYEVVV